MENYVTIQQAADITAKSARTVQRRFDKAKKRDDLGLTYPIFKYHTSDKGGRVKLFSVEWLGKEFTETEMKPSATEDTFVPTGTNSGDMAERLIAILERERAQLVSDKEELVNIIGNLTESLQLEQKKVAQLEFERVQIGVAKEKSEGGLSNMSMSEWWASQNATTDDVETTNTETNSETFVEDVEEVELPTATSEEPAAEEVEAKGAPRSSTFTDWLNSTNDKLNDQLL